MEFLRKNKKRRYKLQEKLDDVKIEIDKTNCPIKELQMLMDIYDIQVSDISKYLVYEHIKPEYVNNAVENFVEQWFNKNRD